MKISKYIKRCIGYLIHGTPVEYVQANVQSIPTNRLLEGRYALVTGGTSGIGRAIAVAFIKSGATVVITGRDQDRVENVADEIQRETGGRVIGVEMDNTHVESMPSCIAAVETAIDGNHIDILVNNAGVNGGNFDSCTENEYQYVMDTNLKGMFFLSRYVSNIMIEHHIEGNILNVASSSSLRPATTAYTLSKWGIRGLTIGLAKKLINKNIVVNGIAPGPTATPMLLKSGGKNIYLPNNPSKRYALPEEIASMAVVLTSRIGRMVVGDIVYMTGGAGTITVDDINY